ncbi:IclR family transcriptional regulator [Chloroflexota bacterium]
METRDSPKTIQSVERACHILFSFSLEHPRWRMSELSESLGLHPSTVSRLLTTMKEMGVVKKDPVTQQYELSLGILQLSRVVLSQLDLVKITLPIMSALVERCRESVFLVVLDGWETVTIAQVAAPRVFSPRPYTVGQHYQASAVSGGKLLLAHGPPCVVDQLIEEGLTAYTERTITSPQQLLAELDKVRCQGYAVTDQELEIGLVAVAAPIWDADNVAAAAISVSGPPDRVGHEHLPGFIAHVRETAEQISGALGRPRAGGHQ